jgi:hypothetical protein
MNTSSNVRGRRRAATFLATAVGGALLVAAPSPALATPGAPLAQCPQPYLIWDAAYGPVTMATDLAGNNDGWVCRLPFRAGVNYGIANVIDNHVPLHVGG